MQKIKNIILTDDHVIIRNGLKELIEKLGPYKITGEYDNGKEMVDAYPFQPAPDLIILDMEMPLMNGSEVVSWLKKNKCTIPVLLLTLQENESLIISMFRQGVRGYLHKNCSSATLRKAIDDILETGYYHDDMLTKALITQDIAPDPKARILLQLTDREVEFIRLVCDPQEYTYEQIGNIMNVHARTAYGYRESLGEKFGIKSKTGLVLFAVKNGIIDL